MTRMLIIGAKSFAKELLEAVVQRNADAKVTFYDDISDDLPDLIFERYPVIRTAAAAAEYFRGVDKGFALGIGKPSLRKLFFNKFVALGGEPRIIISPFAKIGLFGNNIGDGVCVLTDAVVESNNNIGKGSLIHVGALISHDVAIGEFCEISPRVNLLGAVKVGTDCSFGTGCVILPRINIGNNVTVGAGAVVTKDVTEYMTVVGVPARQI